MEEYKKVVIMKLGKKINGVVYSVDDKIKFPKKAPVYLEFDPNKLLGFAQNFRKIKDEIVCDIFLDKEPGDTVVPSVSFIQKKKEDLVIAQKTKLRNLALIDNPADKSLKRNIYKSKKTKRRC